MGMFGEFAFVVSGVLVLCAPAFAAGGAPRVPVNRVTSEGFIRQWLVVGGFPNRRIEGAAEGAVSREGYERDFLEPVGGEASGAFDPAHGVPYEDAEGNSAVAEPFLVSAASDGLLDLAAAFDGATDAVAYAYCRIQSDGPERVSAYFGSDDSAKVYLNGELVHSVWTPGRAAVRWTESFPLELRQGANDLLVKVEQRVGGWGFYLELYRAGDMDAARLSRVENITFETESLVLPAGTGAIRGTITPGPVDGPVIMPAAASLNDADGNVLISQSVVTGRPISLPLPDGYGGYVEAHFTASREGRPDLTSEERFYIGDYEGDKAALLQKARAAVARCRAQLNDADPRVQRAARRRLTLARLAEDWLAWDFGPLDGRNIEVFARMRPAIEALARGEDYQLAHPGSLPAMLDLPEGMSMPAITFWVSLPEGYAEGGPWPVIIHLHGFGGRRPWTPRTAHPNEGALWNYKHGVPMPYICITPATNARWDTAVLDLLLDHVLDVYNADPDRVALTGFSMGGFGTYAWATARPERFSALAVLAGAGRNSDLSRIAHIPIWICHGAHDRAVPFEAGMATAKALEELGADVRYSIFPEHGHGIQAELQHTEEFWAWLAGHKRTKPEDSRH